MYHCLCSFPAPWRRGLCEELSNFEDNPLMLVCVRIACTSQKELKVAMHRHLEPVSFATNLGSHQSFLDVYLVISFI